MTDVHSPHDTIDVKVNNKITIYSNVTLIGSISVASVGFLFLAIWLTTHWAAAVMLSSLLVYGFVTLMGLSAIGLVAALWVKFVVHPSAGAYERVIEAKGQDIRNKLIHAQENGIVYVDEKGHLKVEPLLSMQQRDIYHHKPEHLMEAPTGDTIPPLVRYEDIKYHVPSGHTLLGIGCNGTLETRPFEALDTLCIFGGSKTGKTNTMSIKVDEAYQLRCKFLVIDPHAQKSDSLSHAITSYQDAFLLPVARTYEEMEQALQLFLAEARARIGGKPARERWIVMIDETGSLTGDKSKSAEQERLYTLIYNVARACGQELRGFNMAGWFISQNAVRLAWLRSFAMTIIVHKLLMANEREIATNTNRAVMQEMDRWPKGRTLVYGLDLDEQIVLQQPLFGSVTRQTTDELMEASPMRSPQTERPTEVTLDDALAAWNNGATSVRNLRDELGITYYRANHLYQELKTKRLID